MPAPQSVETARSKAGGEPVAPPERPEPVWNSLEVVKLAVAFAIPVSIALATHYWSKDTDERAQRDARVVAMGRFADAYGRFRAHAGNLIDDIAVSSGGRASWADLRAARDRLSDSYAEVTSAGASFASLAAEGPESNLATELVTSLQKIAVIPLESCAQGLYRLAQRGGSGSVDKEVSACDLIAHDRRRAECANAVLGNLHRVADAKAAKNYVRDTQAISVQCPPNLAGSAS